MAPPLLPLTRERRAVAAALLFLASAALAGISPRAGGVRYEMLGMVEGVFALLLAHLFLARGVWAAPRGWTGWVAVGYGTAATAQLLTLLLPPPGVVQWVVVTGLAFSAWAAFAARTPAKLLTGLGTTALLLALLRFSVIPFLWERAGPEAGTGWGLGDLAEGFRRLFVEYEPIAPGGELVGVAAIVLWAVGTRVMSYE